jgi:biopolymer transport protein TolR
MARLSTRARRELREAIRRRTAIDPSEQRGELNIVPFLDVVVNLMLFLLATSAATLSIAEADVTLPAICSGAECGHAPPGLELSVTLTRGGVVVAGRGGRLAPGCTETTGAPSPTIARTASGYDFDALRACAERLHAAHPRERSVIVGADPEVPYQALIGAIDAVRGSPEAPLFPRVRISTGVR